MSQPAFWLKITPAYVIENFEELLAYVSAYDYNSDEPEESDFNRTVTFLSQVAHTFTETALESCVEKMPAMDVEPRTAMRMVAAAILCEYKRGVVAYDLIAGLIKMLLHYVNVPAEHKKAFIAVLSGCARKAGLSKLPLYFSELDAAQFSELTFTARLASIHWDTADLPRAYYEGHGCVLFDDNGIELAPMNHADILKSEGKGRILFDTGMQVYVTDTDAKRCPLTEIIDTFPVLLRELSMVELSKPSEPKTYHDGDFLDVRVTEVYGWKIVCESTDPAYEKLAGKLLLDKYNFGMSREILSSNLKPGDILPARYCPYNENNLIFEIDQSDEENMKEEYMKHEGLVLKAIYECDYRFGTRWLTELGMQVNILNRYKEYINFEEHDHEGACLKVRITEVKRDRNNKVVLNGEFLPESEQIFDDVEIEDFRQTAHDRLALFLLKYMRETSTVNINAVHSIDAVTTAQPVKVLASLLLDVADHAGPTTEERLALIATAGGMFACLGDEEDLSLARRNMAFQKALIGFAIGESPIALSYEPESAVNEFPSTDKQRDIVTILKNFKERDHLLRASETFSGDIVELVRQLVAASNTLIDKIDAAELSRIKKNIAAKLGVADVFRDSNRDRAFFGFESDTLEFKISCVRPPQNRRAGSAEEDTHIQAFAILKTVCAFLNSPVGGDLLIGVDDEGYAVGVQNDIDILADLHLIQERNIDRLRVYLKNIIDMAFVSNDGNVSGSAITAGNVLVAIEQYTDSKPILRIKIKPYPYDVVRINDRYCLPGHQNVYYRSSAISTPLNIAGVRNLRLHKIKSLDPNERKIAVILEAIDQQRIVKVTDYRDEHGLADYQVEPHAMVMNNTAFQAFDLSSSQMRLFRLSRAGQIELMQASWKHIKKHHSLPIDIFGMMQSEDTHGESVQVKMSDYAIMLLGEEFPASKSKEMAVFTENKGADSKQFPWIMQTTLYNVAALHRFTSGLPDDTLII